MGGGGQRPHWDEKLSVLWWTWLLLFKVMLSGSSMLRSHFEVNQRKRKQPILTANTTGVDFGFNFQEATAENPGMAGLTEPPKEGVSWSVGLAAIVTSKGQPLPVLLQIQLLTQLEILDVRIYRIAIRRT